MTEGEYTKAVVEANKAWVASLRKEQAKWIRAARRCDEIHEACLAALKAEYEAAEKERGG